MRLADGRDEPAAILRDEPLGHVHQVPDGPGPEAGLPRDAPLDGDEAAHPEREQPAGEASAVR